MKKWRCCSAIFAVMCMAAAAVCWAAPGPSASHPAVTAAVSQVEVASPVTTIAAVDQSATLKAEQRLTVHERPAWAHVGASAKTAIGTFDSKTGIQADREGGIRNSPMRT